MSASPRPVMTQKIFSAFSLMCVSGLLITSAHAESMNQKSDWQFGAGLGAYYVPDYPGAKHVHQIITPIPYLSYNGPYLKLRNGRISTLLFDSDRLELNLSADGTPPAKSKPDSLRAGMPDLDPVLEIGPAVEYMLYRTPSSQLMLDVSVRYGIATDLSETQGIGWLANPRLKYVVRHQGWIFRTSAGPIYADHKHNSYYYGVNDAYSTAERPSFKAEGGYNGLSWSLGLQKKIKQLKYDAYLRCTFLNDSSIEDSPLIEYHRSVLGGLAVTWLFKDL